MDILKEIASFEKERDDYQKKGDFQLAGYFQKGIEKLKKQLASASSEKPSKSEKETAILGVARDSDILAGNFDNDPNGNCWSGENNFPPIGESGMGTEKKDIGGSKTHTYIEPQKIPEKKSVKKTYTSWQLKQGSNFKEYQEIVNGIRDTIRTMLKFPNCDKQRKKKELEKQLDYAAYWIKENFLEDYQKMAFEKSYKIKDRKFWLDKEATLNEYFKQ